MDTIYALATARGRSGVAVIRVSGPRALDGLTALTGLACLKPRTAILRELKHPVSRETLDRALVFSFVAPNSFTGEDVVEYHVHGGLAVISSVQTALSELYGYRMAQPGEFTRRAFENGKMDLTEVEGLADLINAETQIQKAQAMAQMNGVLSRLYEGWKDSLARILAHVEADLEFPDEDLPDGILPQMMPKILCLIEEMNVHLNDNRRGERLREGLQIVVAGAPNAGKSSLVNAMAQRDIAIVSEIAGTTRDIIEAHLDIGGYPVILADTAGLRPDQIDSAAEQDTIEAEGIRRALARAQNADITILLYDGTKHILDPHTLGLETLPHVIPVLSKADQTLHVKHPNGAVEISVKNGTGIDVLLTRILTEIQFLVGVTDEAPSLTRHRHREALVNCVQSLSSSLKAPLPELAAEDLRLAIRDLGRITGKVDVEDLLDIIFRDFCIGK